MFCYNFNWLTNQDQWYQPFIINNRIIDQYTLDDFRMGKSPYECLFNAGWHFSYFQSIPDLIRKVESFSHSEYNKEEIKDKDYIKSCIKDGLFFLNNIEATRLRKNTNFDLPDSWKEIQNKLENSYNVYT